MTGLKQRFEGSTDVVGAWLSIGHPTVAEVTAAQGFDFVLVDTEHTPIGLETVENMSRAVDAADGATETVVRVPSDDPVRLKRVLDIGVTGVMVPMVETGAQARRVVEATRYPPQGIRGVASGRAAEYGAEFVEYVETADEAIFRCVQIETRTGLDNAESIATTDGIDAVFVGPADLSANLGVFGEWDDDRFTEAIDRVVDATAGTGTPVGTLVVDPDDIETRLEQGFDYLIAGKDTSHLASANRAVRERFEATVDRLDEPSVDD